MKKIAVALGLLLLLAGTSAAFAAKGGEKGASAQAYEHASDQSIFNRVGDWFATIGKSGEEKARILEERRAERARKRAQKEEAGSWWNPNKEAKGAKGSSNPGKGLGKGKGKGLGK